MKNRQNIKDSDEGNASHKSSARHVTMQDVQNAEDSEDDDEDEEHDIPITVTTSVADTCSASHEFEWLSPNSQNMPLPQLDKQGAETSYQEEPTIDTQQPTSLEEQGSASCQVSPVRNYHRHRKSPAPFWPKRSADGECRLSSPTPCQESHACHRHLSPMRSTWCCPSPPPHAVCMHHHGGSIVSGLELVPYNRECYSADMTYWPYQSCSCLPPTGLPPRYHESYNWCRNPSPHHEILRRESSSPCATYRSCQGVSRRSRSTGSRKRDYSPSALSPRYSPVSNEQAQNHSTRQSGQENWQATIHSEDVIHVQKIQQLESDKKNLLLQTSVLADQIDAQSDKITELERLLDHKKDQLNNLEQNLHQEMLTRSTIENNKLELMTELSNLRLRLTAAERDRKDSDERCRKLENELVSLHARLTEKEMEHFALKNKLLRNGTIVSTNDKNSELEKLQLALDSVMVSNDEKDRKIDDLRLSLNKYKKLQEFVLSSHTRKVSDSSVKDTQLTENDCCSDYVTSSSLGNDGLANLNNDGSPLKSHISRSQNPTSSTPNQFDSSALSWKESAVSRCSPTSIRSSPATYNAVPTFHKSNSVENICPSSSKVTPVKNQFGTMPRQTGPQALQHLQEQLQRHEADTSTLPRSGESSDGLQCSPVARNEKGVILPFSNEQSRPSRNKSSGVSFAPQECVTIPITEKENSSTNLQPFTQQYVIKPEKDKNKGFLKFFSKWKRTGSQNIEKIDCDFKRGGVRATAGPRLGWSRDVSSDPEIPFDRWDTDLLVEWLQKIGLSMYTSECKRWMCNGKQLLNASPQELEKELNVKNPLHKKKLSLAIKGMNSGFPDLPDTINRLDYQWVIRWLDDIGLPQYKDSFADARVDGRVLHYLTVEDLLLLKVVSQLHHVSIKRGIQVLREKNFDPHCLVRRSFPDENKSYTPKLVALWTNHRVMEWLRTVDLSEYAPNLRGSGVHGALIVYEPKFNTDLFATLLNIPPTKTLLRRHLATHFKHVVGSDLIQLKRDKETDQSYTPLSPSVKIKMVRKNQFVLKKKRSKGEGDNEEYVCPMDIPVLSEVAKPPEGDKLIVRRNSDPSPQEPRLLDLQEEETAGRIGAVSKEIKTLTTLLQGETLLHDTPTTVV